MTRLEPMGEARFGPFLDRLILSYAEDHIRTGRWSADEGPREARREIDRLLPSGVATPGHAFFSIVAGSPEQVVGVIWLAIEPRGAFVYDLEIDAPFRRHGYAEEAMRLLEGEARERGARKLLLHVFGDNVGARRLYEKLGFAETNVMMAKSLVP